MNGLSKRKQKLEHKECYILKNNGKSNVSLMKGKMEIDLVPEHLRRNNRGGVSRGDVLTATLLGVPAKTVRVLRMSGPRPKRKRAAETAADPGATAAAADTVETDVPETSDIDNPVPKSEALLLATRCVVGHAVSGLSRSAMFEELNRIRVAGHDVGFRLLHHALPEAIEYIGARLAASHLNTFRLDLWLELYRTSKLI